MRTWFKAGKMMPKRWQMIGVVGVLIAVGCSKSEEQPPIVTATGEVPPAAEATSAKKSVPSSVNDAERKAVDVQQEIMKKDWSKASDHTRSLQELSAKMKQDSVSAPDLVEYDSTVATLSAKVSEKDQIPAALTANEVYRAALAMTSQFSDAPPQAVGLIGADARDALYYAMAGDWESARSMATSLAANYREVEPAVKARDTKFAAEVSQHIKDLDQAITAKDTAAVNTASAALQKDTDTIREHAHH